MSAVASAVGRVQMSGRWTKKTQTNKQTNNKEKIKRMRHGHIWTKDDSP